MGRRYYAYSNRRRLVVFGDVIGYRLSKKRGLGHGGSYENFIEEASKNALRVRKPPKGWIHHSDQDSQYTSQEFTQLLEKEAAQISMYHKGRSGTLFTFLNYKDVEIIRNHKKTTES